MCISCVCECVSMRECVCVPHRQHPPLPTTHCCVSYASHKYIVAMLYFVLPRSIRPTCNVFIFTFNKKKYWSETTIFFVVVKWIGWIWSGNGNDRVIFFAFVFFSVRNCDCHSIYWAKQPDQIYMHSYNLILNYYVWCADGEEAVSMAFHLWFQIFQYLFHKMNVL